MQTTLVDLYSKSMNQRQRAESQYLIVNRLLSLCLSLHEYPLIRYRSDNKPKSFNCGNGTKAFESAFANAKTSGIMAWMEGTMYKDHH